MNREERLQLCRKCKHKKNTLKEGIICGLTDKPADFEEKCEHHIIDEERLEEIIKRNESIRITDNIVPRWKRFVTYLIDYAGYQAFAFTLGIIFAILGLQNIILGANEIILSLSIFFVYYLLFESIFAQTPGKMILRIVVVNKDGNKPGFMQILGRTLCRFIPFDPLSFFKSDAIGWHDSISETRVIDKRLSKEKQKTNDDILDEIEF